MVVSVDVVQSPDAFERLGDRTITVATTDDDEPPGPRIVITETDGQTAVSESGAQDTIMVALATPVGSNVLGPGLADLQGQIAAEKLKLMMGLPGLYNQPIATQGSFASNFLSQAQNPNMMTQQTSAPLGPQIGAQVGAGLSGISQALGQQQAQQNQVNFQNQLLKQLQQNQNPAGQYPGYENG